MNRNSNTWNVLITIIRVAVGWHLLYEGLSKLLTSEWSASSYLSNTSGWFSGFYHWLASRPEILRLVDFLNIYGLVLIGLGLSLGLFTRVAAWAGFSLLALYYFAYPPFGVSNLWSTDHLFVVDKVFIEAMVLLWFALNPASGYRLDALISLFYRENKTQSSRIPSNTAAVPSRREAIKHLSTIPFIGLLGWGALKDKESNSIDGISGGTIQVNSSSLSELKGEMPKGMIKNHEISRLILGGNLIGGWAHSRDLIYVSSLFKAYNTEKKIFETLLLAEQAGINTINIGFNSNPLLQKYKRITGSKIKVISQVAPNMKSGDYFEQTNKAIDLGADIIQVQGNWCDWLVRDQRLDVIYDMLEKIRSQGYTAGQGAHTVDAFIACEKEGIVPDYYMQTMHHDNYWSAHPRENRFPFEVDGELHKDHDRFHDNIFCLFPDRTVDFVNRVKIPVMGFKVLAAGAIEPEDGFRWAFEHGADFICVGMFDFQIVNDVNITLDILANIPNRERAWYG